MSNHVCVGSDDVGCSAGDMIGAPLSVVSDEGVEQADKPSVDGDEHLSHGREAIWPMAG